MPTPSDELSRDGQAMFLASISSKEHKRQDTILRIWRKMFLMSKNTVCHIEIDVTDLIRSLAFYEVVFDWKFRPFMDTMVAFGAGDDHVGGLSKVDVVRPGKSPSIWISVDDIDETLTKAQKAGGKVVSAKSDVPTVGFSAIFSDLDGSEIGIVQFVRD